MNTVTVRQAVVADLEALSSLFDDYRQFQGTSADLPACRQALQRISPQRLLLRFMHI